MFYPVPAICALRISHPLVALLRMCVAFLHLAFGIVGFSLSPSHYTTAAVPPAVSQGRPAQRKDRQNEMAVLHWESIHRESGGAYQGLGVSVEWQ